MSSHYTWVSHSLSHDRHDRERDWKVLQIITRKTKKESNRVDMSTWVDLTLGLVLHLGLPYTWVGIIGHHTYSILFTPELNPTWVGIAMHHSWVRASTCVSPLPETNLSVRPCKGHVCQLRYTQVDVNSGVMPTQLRCQLRYDMVRCQLSRKAN